MKTNTDNWFILDERALGNIKRAATTAITQSEIMLRASCARKWFYRHALRLEKRGYLDLNLVYGSLIHALLERLYGGDDAAYATTPKERPVKVTEAMLSAATNGLLLKPTDHAEIDLVAARVQIHFDAYRMHYHQQDAKLIIKAVERVFEFEWHGTQLAAKLDLVAKPNRQDGVFIWDFKSAGSLDATLLDAWSFRFQFLFYSWIYWKATGDKPSGIIVNSLLKSALRPKIVDRKTKRKETKEEYLFRVRGEMMANREKYFIRQRIPLAAGMLERFEREMLLPHIQAFSLLKRSDEATGALAMQMNTNQCHLYNSYCEYLNLCKDGRLALSEYDQRETKHPELATENNDDE